MEVSIETEAKKSQESKSVFDNVAPTTHNYISDESKDNELSQPAKEVEKKQPEVTSLKHQLDDKEERRNNYKRDIYELLTLKRYHHKTKDQNQPKGTKY